jgi:hypothetical protein
MKNFLSLSRIVNWLIIISLAYVILNTGSYKKPFGVIKDDIVGYYTYLPATFIYHDISLKFTLKDPAYYYDKILIAPTPSGGYITKYPMGIAILYSPFFFICHFIAKLTGEQANGYTSSYQLALQLSCLFYLTIGLFFLRKTLLKYYSEVVTSLSILAVTVGTNLYYYASVYAPMSHVYSFSLIAIFIWVTINWYKTPNLKYSVLIGLVGGLITLVRPTNVIVFLFFTLWGITGWKEMIIRAKLFLTGYSLLIMMFVCFILVWIPQLLYWKYNAGHWFYYSYYSERFFFNDPQFINGLFSYRNGWLIYTPIMVFALAGIFFMIKGNKDFFLPVLIFTIANIYIIVSWWTWWYGGSYGLRPMIDSYSVLIFPMAAFIRYILNSRIIIRITGVMLISVLIIHSVFQTIQYHHGAIHYDSMTRAAYWDSFGRIHPSGKFYSLLKQPDYDKAKKGERDN